MFNLDHAIVEWRRQLAAAGISSPAVLDELENHLRDDIASQLEAGANAQQAFDAAVGRIGNPTTLRSEFAKSAPKSRPRKLIRALCFSTAIAVLLINTWTLQQFDLSIFERFAGFSIVAFVALYLATLPFLRRFLSKAGFGRFTAALKIATTLLSIAIIVMFLVATHVLHLEIGIVTNMVVWSLGVAILLSPFALLFDPDKLHGGTDGPDGSPPSIFPGICPPSWPRVPGSWRREIQLPSSESFTPVARQCMQIARGEAARLGHDFIGTEHLLLGVLAQAKGALATILRNINLDCHSVRAQIERLVSVQPAHSSPVLPLTPRACKALQIADTEAKTFRNAGINPEHVLLGLLIEGSGVAALALKNLGVRIDRMRAEISRVPAQR